MSGPAEFTARFYSGDGWARLPGGPFVTIEEARVAAEQKLRDLPDVLPVGVFKGRRMVSTGRRSNGAVVWKDRVR